MRRLLRNAELARQKRKKGGGTKEGDRWSCNFGRKVLGAYVQVANHFRGRTGESYTYTEPMPDNIQTDRHTYAPTCTLYSLPWSATDVLESTKSLRVAVRATRGTRLNKAKAAMVFSSEVFSA